jgi:hypothetical protein
MKAFPNYDDVYRTPEQSELNKILRVLFIGIFVTAVFVVPSVTVAQFFIA